MIPGQTCLHRARITIELTSPMMIATGQSLNTNDNALVRDENGWPMIPGTTIAGVLRSLLRQASHKVEDCFGKAGSDQKEKDQRENDQKEQDQQGEQQQKNDQKENDQQMLSAVQFSAAMVHDSQNRICEASKDIGEFDELLMLLAGDVPVLRNGVAIDIRGVAKDKSKHDRTLVPTGARFSFWMSWWSQSIQPTLWKELLSMLAHPMCSFGGGRRIGQGAFALVDIRQVLLDLTDASDAERFRRLPKSLAAPLSGGFTSVKLNELKDLASGLLPVQPKSLTLQSENGWRVGGGSCAVSDKDRSSGLFPYTETRIQWQQHKAEIIDEGLVMPGSAIKGAFAHRLEFHFRRLQGIWADDTAHEYRDTDVKHLLGWVAGKQAQVGHLWFSDGYLSGEVKYHLRTRNKIDRLTGGTINQALFVEERVHGGQLSFSMFFDEQALQKVLERECEDNATALLDTLQQAIDYTLRDIKQGRLALGAGQNNGSGFFTEVTTP